MASILFLPIILFAATFWLYLLITIHVPKSEDVTKEINFPSNLEELKTLSTLLKKYSRGHPLYVVVLFVSAYIYKQTFAIPGSVFLNLMAGAIFGIWVGFPLTCLLSAVGASCCFFLSKLMGRDHIIRFFPDKVSVLQAKVRENSDRLLYFLLFIRLFPMTPNWFINITAPVLNIPIHLFFISVLIGLMPYNFICVQTGVILRDLQSMDDIFSFKVLLQLTMVAIAALVPTLMKNKVKKVVKS